MRLQVKNFVLLSLESFELLKKSVFKIIFKLAMEEEESSWWKKPPVVYA
jgi:hypothetical protein